MAIDKLGKYEIIERIGSGATADVYHARDNDLGREVALKVLKPESFADQSTRERFIQEAQSAASLFHPNIATVLDRGEEQGRYFIAMRYIPGKSLDRILREDGPLHWSEALRLAQQIGAALDYAHTEGFLHRDVKPSNIIHDEKDDFWLTDFGLTRAMTSTGLTSTTGALMGTPPYIPPEIWDGRSALACVVYEALTGEVLFCGETHPAIMTAHILKGAKLPEQWPQDVPAGLSAVLAKALHKEPDERWASASDFAEAMTNPPPVLPPLDLPSRAKTQRKALPLLTAISIGWGVSGLLPILMLAVMTLLCDYAIICEPLNGTHPIYWVAQVSGILMQSLAAGVVLGLALWERLEKYRLSDLLILLAIWAMAGLFFASHTLATILSEIFATPYELFYISPIVIVAGAILGGMFTAFVVTYTCERFNLTDYLLVAAAWSLGAVIGPVAITIATIEVLPQLLYQLEIFFAIFAIASPLLHALGGLIGGSVILHQINQAEQRN